MVLLFVPVPGPGTPPIYVGGVSPTSVTYTSSPSVNFAARFSATRFALGNGPPAACNSSKTLAPAASVYTPGCFTAPTIYTCMVPDDEEVLLIPLFVLVAEEPLPKLCCLLPTFVEG